VRRQYLFVEASIELRQLRYFVAVAEELHFGRAAERLHMSQSPLSRAIRDLECELGLVLFVRTTRRVELTAAGAVLLERSRQALIEIEWGDRRRASRGGAGFGCARDRLWPVQRCGRDADRGGGGS
jgi:DNA-binding transcriptional LysR family regulator